MPLFDFGIRRAAAAAFSDLLWAAALAAVLLLALGAVLLFA